MKTSNSDVQRLFENFWQQFILNNPCFPTLYQHFSTANAALINDHIALRTLDNCAINLECIEDWLKALGFEVTGEYLFEVKKLRAKSFKFDKHTPRIFVSELLTEKIMPQLPPSSNQLLTDISNTITDDSIDQLFGGCQWHNINLEDFKSLSKVSEYAAWFVTNGFCANHFTLSVNDLKPEIDLETVNRQVEALGFNLNQSGGEIKGQKGNGLRQSSTLAYESAYLFNEPFGEKTSSLIPRCYVEFAQRYQVNGEWFDGFEQANADKIFESTDKRAK